VGEDPISAVDRTIDRLDDALRAAGFGELAPAADETFLEELEREIAPYSLPRDLRRLWERVQFSSLRVRGYSLPEPCEPRDALDTHRLNLDPQFFPLYGPPLLFPIARISGDQWSVELASRWSEGGVVFSHGDWTIRIEYPSLSDLLDVYAELLEEGRFVRANGYGALHREDEQERQQARLAAMLPHPLYGDGREISREPSEWPAHWLESAGIDLRDREPLGVTHTIAELVEASTKGPVRARIAGEVVRLVGSTAGVLAIVTDGTRALDVWCPAESSYWGPAMRQRFEFEVTVEEPIRPPPDVDTGHREVQEHALAGRVEAAATAVDSMWGRILEHRPAAVASAVRPLD
jgi:hypothetical protein